jgi:phosphatidylglycerophosphate synthase
MFKLDLIINDYIVKHSLCLFKHIHPNIITLIGMMINFIIFFLYFQPGHYKTINSILLILRILADNLDGMVARHYKKTSDIGGLLDTISDNILSIMIVYCLSYYFIPFYALYCGITFGIIMLVYLYCNDALTQHTNFMENNEDGFINKVAVFLSYNTYLICLSIITLMWLS